MFYTIDHLTTAEQTAFEAAYAAVIAAEEQGMISPANLDRADEALAWAAACDPGHASKFIEEAWAWLT